MHKNVDMIGSIELNFESKERSQDFTNSLWHGPLIGCFLILLNPKELISYY